MFVVSIALLVLAPVVPTLGVPIPCGGECAAGVQALDAAAAASLQEQPTLTDGDRRWLTNQRRRIEEARQQQNFQRAVNLTEKIVERFPENLTAWMLLAEIHLQPSWVQRSDSRAEQAAEAALRIGGRDPRILTALATAKYHQRRVDEAMALIAELLDGPRVLVEPMFAADLLVARATMRRESAEAEERALARSDLERAIELVPLHGGARLERAEHRYLAREHEAALRDLEAVRHRMPGNRKFHYLSFKCYRALGRKDESVEAKEVYDLIHRLTSVVSSRTAPDPEETLHILRELWVKNPLDQNRNLQRVNLEIEFGYLDRARAAIEELRGRDPDWPPLAFLERQLAAAESGDGSGEGKDGDSGEEADGGGRGGNV